MSLSMSVPITAPSMQHSIPVIPMTMPSVNPNGYSDNCNLFIFHLPASVDDEMLYRLFEPFGSLQSVKVMVDPQTGESRGFGFVQYYNIQDALHAINVMNGCPIESKHLKVTFKDSVVPQQHHGRNRRSNRKLNSNGRSRENGTNNDTNDNDNDNTNDNTNDNIPTNINNSTDALTPDTCILPTIITIAKGDPPFSDQNDNDQDRENEIGDEEDEDGDYTRHSMPPQSDQLSQIEEKAQEYQRGYNIVEQTDLDKN